MVRGNLDNPCLVGNLFVFSIPKLHLDFMCSLPQYLCSCKLVGSVNFTDATVAQSKSRVSLKVAFVYLHCRCRPIPNSSELCCELLLDSKTNVISWKVALRSLAQVKGRFSLFTHLPMGTN